MAVGYDKKTLSLTAATVHRLSDLLEAEGYTGSMVGAFLELDDVNSLNDVLHGSDSTVATTGRPLTSFYRAAPPAVDPGAIYLYSLGGGDVAVTFMPM